MYIAASWKKKNFQNHNINYDIILSSYILLWMKFCWVKIKNSLWLFFQAIVFIWDKEKVINWPGNKTW